MRGLFGDLFDFNGDGTTDLGEDFLEFMMIEEIFRDDDEEDGETDIWEGWQ